MLRIDHPRCLGAIVIAVSCGAFACGGDGGTRPPQIENRPPEVRRFEVVEDRVHAAEEVTVVASAADPDRDPLDYFWSVNRGSLPFGRVGNSVKWLTPSDRAVDTVTVRVTDREDTVYARLPVELIRVFPPDSVWTVNYASAADLAWAPSPDDGILHWVGYDVYMSNESLAGRSEAEVEPFRITSEPQRTRTRRVLGLVAGTRYYFHVRSVRQYEGTTERSLFRSEASMAPRRSGDVSGLLELASSGPTVLDLSEGTVRRLDPEDPSDRERADLYAEADPTAPAERVLLRSVSHLASFDPAWGERVVELKHLGEDFGISGTDPETGWDTEVAVLLGSVVAVRTPEGNYGKVRITNIQRAYPNRNLWLTWAYQPIVGYVSF